MAIWYIILLAVWAAALVSQREHIASLARLYFHVISPHDRKGEKAMMLLDIIPMGILFIAFYVIIWPIPAAAISLFRKFFAKS